MAEKYPSFALKGGSAAVLHSGWHEEVPETVRPRSSLLQRPASHPQLVPDLSVEHVEETLYRKTLHSYLTSEQPGAFKKFVIFVSFLLVS